MPETARRIVLASRPVGEPKPSDFRLEEFPVPQPGPGQMLLRTPDVSRRGRWAPLPAPGRFLTPSARRTCGKPCCERHPPLL